MSDYEVYLSKPAENDLREIVNYISSQFLAPMTAQTMLETFEDAIAGLADMPAGYPQVTDERLLSMGYRKLFVRNYIAFFTINEKEKTVAVERILYARRDWIHIL